MVDAEKLGFTLRSRDSHTSHSFGLTPFRAVLICRSPFCLNFIRIAVVSRSPERGYRRYQNARLTVRRKARKRLVRDRRINTVGERWQESRRLASAQVRGRAGPRRARQNYSVLIRSSLEWARTPSTNALEVWGSRWSVLICATPHNGLILLTFMISLYLRCLKRPLP